MKMRTIITAGIAALVLTGICTNAYATESTDEIVFDGESLRSDEVYYDMGYDETAGTTDTVSGLIEDTGIVRFFSPPVSETRTPDINLYKSNPVDPVFTPSEENIISRNNMYSPLLSGTEKPEIHIYKDSLSEENFICKNKVIQIRDSIIDNTEVEGTTVDSGTNRRFDPVNVEGGVLTLNPQASLSTESLICG